MMSNTQNICLKVTRRKIQEVGSDELSGMIISRRPNRRASKEKAPGPSSRITIAITLVYGADRLYPVAL